MTLANLPSDLDPQTQRRVRILDALRHRSIDQAALDKNLWNDFEEEAKSVPPEQRIITPEMLGVIREVRSLQTDQPHLKLFSNSDDVIIIPGFLGSELVDGIPGGDGLIWIDPTLLINPGQLSDLKLAAYRPNQPKESDANPRVQIQPHGPIPIIYSLLKTSLELGPFRVDIFGFDWRKSIQESAEDLADVIRARLGQTSRPLHLVAHSQGSLVARRALQLLGSEVARKLVNTLVLLGPASGGTFSAAFALTGNASLLDTMRRFGVRLPPDFTSVVQSMTGVYQLLPWRTKPVDGFSVDMKYFDWLTASRKFFATDGPLATNVDSDRLKANWNWADRIDTSFFNDRTSIILGGQPQTAGGVKFDPHGKLVPDDQYNTAGDGTVPDALAILPGVERVYKLPNAEHMLLPTKWATIRAVQRLLAGKMPTLQRVGPGVTDDRRIPLLEELEPPVSAVGVATAPGDSRANVVAAQTTAVLASVPPAVPTPTPRALPQPNDVPPPQTRRLRVYSFDPLLGNDLESLDIDQITLELPWSWADGNQLSPGPIGEYLEVIDYDPANGTFYPPVDLSHPHLLAEDGLAPTEGDPRFHQQMVYAVAMNTILQFERALGRPVLWAPHLRRDPAGEVISSKIPEDEFVRRLRIYPHAMQEANAYYHPDRKALLFGYFRAVQDVGQRNCPGGLVFSCLSYDIIAHETTHALLDGVHRYLIDPSNQDVFAFHEGFADAVAMFQHFSHPNVLRHVIEKTRGDLTRESEAAVLAAQFGDAIGNRGALREYLGRKVRDSDDKVQIDSQGNTIWEPVRPDPSALSKTHEAHHRGAIFVAALFRAFINIYERRVADLRRIAGVGNDDYLTPDLVGRMADEAAKAAQHMLTMAIRAIDYVPPVDLTFGEYLRALITADYDLVRNDQRQYRAAVISAFRDWGIYPSDVPSLSVDALLWKPPEKGALQRLKEFFDENPRLQEDFGGDRLQAYVGMKHACKQLHDWLQQKFAKEQHYRDQDWGLSLDPLSAPHSIGRDRNGNPKFEVHSFRLSHRENGFGADLVDFVVELVQRRKALFDPAQQTALDRGEQNYETTVPDFYFRGGCTLIIDSRSGEIRYCIRKSILDDDRLNRERAFRQQGSGGENAMYLSSSQESANPFAMLHSCQC